MNTSTELQVIDLLSNRKEFIQWLYTFEPDNIVGFTVCTFSCPIANFLKNKLGLEFYVGCYNIFASKDKVFVDYINMNKFSDLYWVTQFIKQLDGSSNEQGEVVSASMALEFLIENEDSHGKTRTLQTV